jgi:non-specific serine/threonine protein kinase
VFAGSFELEAAEGVCGADVDKMQSLVDKSLVRATGADRFFLLETVREYATEQLRHSGELEDTSRRNLEFFLTLAESANLYAEAEGPQDFDTVNADQDNLRAAIAWGLRTGETEPALRLAVGLENFWVTHDPAEGIRLFEMVLDSDVALPADLRARALRALGGSNQVAGNHERAQLHYEQSRELFRQLGDIKGTGILDYRLGLIAVELGHPDRARRLLNQSLEAFRASGSRRGEAQTIGSLGEVARSEGNNKLAASLFEQSAIMCAQIGRKWWQAHMLANLTELALEEGLHEQATNAGRELLRLAYHIGDRKDTLYALVYLAWAAASTGQGRRARRLWGAVQAEQQRQPVAAWPIDQN